MQSPLWEVNPESFASGTIPTVKLTHPLQREGMEAETQTGKLIACSLAKPILP